MNLGIKDGSKWHDYSTRYNITHPRLYLAFYFALWISCGTYWVYVAAPWLSPIFVVWCALWLLWEIRLALSWYYFRKQLIKMLTELDNKINR